MTHSSLRPQIDIFCRVIDNFGDAGVLWRLARELKALGHPVRLIIDDESTLAPLAGLPKNSDLSQYQKSYGIEVLHWEKNWDTQTTNIDPSPVVIEGFACQLPHDFEVKMSQMKQPPLWINVDYFSAEDWVEGCHMMPSVHPSLGIKKIFYFPGVTDRSGSLTIEKNYDERQQAWKNAHKKDKTMLRVLFFGYPYAPLKALAECLAKVNTPIELMLTPTQASFTLKEELERLPSNSQLKINVLPFVNQIQFDELLWLADVAFIRGEDSAARAMIAGVPMVWQIYAQEEDTHLIKLDALVQREKQCFANDELYATWRDFQRYYNQGIVKADLFNKLISQLQSWKQASQCWADKLKKNGSLAQDISKQSLT